MKTQEKDFESYGIFLTLEDLTAVGDGSSKRPKKLELFYPTACKSKEGLRVYGTRFLVGKDGKVRASDNEITQLKDDLGKFKVDVKDCRTVYLTSVSDD